MYLRGTIKKFAAGTMLVLFALSITPKQFLHDVLTKHQHSCVKLGEASTLQAAKNNFQCNWHDQPVKSPFTEDAALKLISPQQPYVIYTDRDNSRRYSTILFFSALRGPPALA